MKFGCCIGLDRVFEGGSGKSAVRLLEMGYDYVELPLSVVVGLTDSEFDGLLAIMGRSHIKAAACNMFFPGTVKLTGPYVDRTVLCAYLRHALDRAARLGAAVLVVGSAGSRNVPAGFPRERAWGQLVEAFQIISSESRPYGITVAAEPLNTKESNIVNTLAEGGRLVREVGMDNIGLLADFYHMAIEKEGADLLPYADILKHTHFAEPEGRVFPKEAKASYEPFFNGLRKIGYSGGVSMECSSGDLLPEAATALQVLTIYS